MFKRRRAQSNPAPNHPPNASASLAATKAFLQNSQSNVALSSAAAAAALRTHPSGPTAVGETVTKRMVRKSSISSHGSGSQQGPGLRRQTSSGSMTERSFRSPSPTNRNSPVIGHHADVPPVPAVPKDVPTISVAQRRASSLEPPYRGASSPRRGNGRGVSVDGARVISGSRPRMSSLSEVPEHDQEGRPRSVNFSRPMSPGDTAAQGVASGWFAAPVRNTEQGFRSGPPTRPKTSSGNLDYDARNAFQSVQNAADRPVSSKRGQLSQGFEDARLATGSMRARPSGSGVAQKGDPRVSGPVDPKSTDAVYDPSTRSFIRKQDAMARFRELHEEDEPPIAHDYHYSVPPPQQVQPQRRLSQHSHASSQQGRVQELSPPRQQLSQPLPVPSHDLYEDPGTPERHASPESFDDLRGSYDSPPRHKEEEMYYKDEPQPREQGPAPRNDAGDGKIAANADDDGLLITRLTSEHLGETDITHQSDVKPSQRPKVTVPESIKPGPESPHSPRFAANQDSAFPRIGSPAGHASTGAKIGRGRGSVRSDRGTSMSPPRNAHFAAGSLELPNGVLHQPPPRSVSPAKSALKASPSQSRRNSSPLANNGRVLSKGASSDVSDVVSEDGTGKKKKHVRVSFEETPVVAGTSAYGEPDAPSSPTGLAKSRWNTSTQEDDLDDLMKPRPALPSFGSVRDKGRRDADRDLEKVTETVSSSMSTSVASVRDPVDASSDFALGSIVAHDYASKKQTSHGDPLPPEVTSVEGSGYYSDSGSSDTAQNETAESQALVPKSEQSIPEPKTLSFPVEAKPHTAEVPEIAIQPATPNLADRTEFSPMAPTRHEAAGKVQPEPFIRLSTIPGGWAEDEDEDDATREPIPSPNASSNITAPESAAVPEPVPTPTRITFAEPTLPPPSRSQEPDASDDDDSIYSDAYEELTDSETGAFASIDNILESTISSPPSGLMQSRFAETVVDHKPTPRESVPAATKPLIRSNADVADQHSSRQELSKVSPPPKQQASSPAAIASTEKKPRAPTAQPKTPKTRETASHPAEKVQTKQPSAQPRKSALKKTAAAVQPSATHEPQMRKTMRGSPGPQTHTSPDMPQLKKTMRGSPGPQAAAVPDAQMRKSMRSDVSAGAAGTALGLAASRHSTLPDETRPAKGALQKRQIPPTAASPKPRPHSAGNLLSTTPAPKYDSDSDASASSFQRERRRKRASRSTDGRYSMRRSMRSDAAPTMRGAPAARPMSPASVASSPPPPSFRKSLRPTSPVSESGAAKSSKFSIRSLSPTGRLLGKSQKHRVAVPVPSAPKSALSSRFDDSSDDEDYASRPRRFQSRFADSDDEDEYQLPPGLAPVRGIPKKAGDDDRDSTDLEDEDSEEDRAKDKEKGQGAVTNGSAGLSKSKHAQTLPTFDSGKKTKAKRGFFGLGKKKEAPSESSETATVPAPREPTDIPLPPPHRERDPNQPLTPIAEDEDKVLEASPAPQRSPKLQRRLTPQWGRSASDSWPLPTPPPIGADPRPHSSDGVGAAARPGLSKRMSSHAHSAKIAIDPKSGKEVVVGRTGKKKKFQGLRRVFGLND